MSARNVLLALDPNRYEPVLIGIDRNGRWSLQEPQFLLGSGGSAQLSVPNASTSITVQPRSESAAPSGVDVDVVFPVLHGPMGEDGTVQGVLELANIPYVGAGVLGSAIGMDKDVMKRLLREAGLPVAQFRSFRRWEYERSRDAILASCTELGFPQFTKPANLGSSVGISRVPDASALAAAIEFAFKFDTKVLAEEAIVGRELECSVLGYHEVIASIPGEIVVRHTDGFYSYDAKYLDESGALLEIPAKLDPAVAAEVQAMSIRAFDVLETQGLARVDFFLGATGKLTINEINTLPGFTAISMYPKLWEASGMSSRELVDRLIQLAFDRHRDRAALQSKQK